MSECLLAVPGMGARSQRIRVRQAVGIWADCLVRPRFEGLERALAMTAAAGRLEISRRP